MENYSSSVYDQPTNSTSASFNTRIYTKTQTSMVTTALLVAGLGFLATGLIGLGFLQLLKQIESGNQNAESIFDVFWALTGVSALVSVVLYFVWMFKVRTASLGFQILTISLFCISNGFTFGGLFYLVHVQDIIIAFSATGLILIIAFVVAKMMSNKAAFSMMKIMMIMLGVYFALVLGSLLMSLFAPPFSFQFNGDKSNEVLNKWIGTIVIAVSGILSLLFLTYNLWMIQRMDQFRETIGVKESRNIAIFFGFMILMNLLRIFYLVINIISRFK